MTKKQKLELTWIGKENRPKLEPRILLADPEKTYHARQWPKNMDTVLFLGVWEQLNNPDFNSLEFEGIKNDAERNSFFLSAKKWIKLTHAIGHLVMAGIVPL